MPRLYLTSVFDLARASVAGVATVIAGRPKAARPH